MSFYRGPYVDEAKAGAVMLPWVVIGLAMVYFLFALTKREKKEEKDLDSDASMQKKDPDSSETDRLEVFREFVTGADWKEDQDSED